MSLNNGVYGHDTYESNFDDVLYGPETDAMLDDRLEEARQNRTNFYRKMLASRSRPLDDYSVSRKVSYRSGTSPAKEPSISDTVSAGPLPQIPEPHSSWRFYTSFDNGEWKRHAVPVHKEEEEILREPSKSFRRVRETERSTQSPQVESTLRKMRQNGGPLLACIQPRPRKTSEGQKTTTTVHSVNGQPMVVGPEFIGQFGLPADWAGIGAVTRRYSDGGTEYLVVEEEPRQGSEKHECTTKYTSTVKVTQPTGSQVRQVVSGKQAIEAAGGGGVVEDGQGATGEAGVRKSRRPRIYGFQERIIIPTKYKNAENQESGGEITDDINTGQSVSKTREETTVKKGSLVEDGLNVNGRRVGMGGVGERVQATEISRSSSGGIRYPKAGSAAQDRPVQGGTVKVVVMNSGSDAEGEKKSAEPFSSEDEKDNSSALKLSTGMPEGFKIPNLFKEGAMEEIKAMHESMHANLLAPGSSVKDQAGSVSTTEDDASLIPNQRVFSKDEQTFSEVGPNGAKCDGKVLRTYEVITTSNEDDSTVENKLLAPSKEVTIVPIEETERSPFKTRAISSTKEVTIVPIEETLRSPFKTRAISSTGEDRATKTNTIEQSGSRFSQQEIHSPRKTVPSLSPKTEDKKATDIFEQTGSLFKTITPRPRNIRDSESVLAAREEHVRKAAGESVQPKLGGVTSKTIRIYANQHDGLKREPDASNNVGAGETIRTRVEHVMSNENRSSGQLHPSGPAEGKVSVRDSLGAFATGDGGFLQSNTNSGVRSQGWSDNTQTKKSNLQTKENEKDWEIRVALKD